MKKETSYGRGGYGGYSRGGGFGGRGLSSGPKPVEVGKEYDVTITETSRRGDGIAKISGFVIFVANTHAGQKARIKVTSVGPRFANAEVVEATESTGTSETVQSSKEGA